MNPFRLNRVSGTFMAQQPTVCSNLAALQAPPSEIVHSVEEATEVHYIIQSSIEVEDILKHAAMGSALVPPSPLTTLGLCTVGSSPTHSRPIYCQAYRDFPGCPLSS